MKKEDFEWIHVNDLRVGLFIELEVGWMAHPFPSGSFKIHSEQQIETLRGLGLTRIRVVPGKSDPLAFDQAVRATFAAQSATQPQPVGRAAPNPVAQREQQVQKLRSEQLALQRNSILACERRFTESARQYRQAVEQVQAHPVAVAQQCSAMVQGFVSEIMQGGESVIRLLSDVPGDKSAMHPVNVMVVSLLLGKSMGLEPAALGDLGIAAFLHDIGKISLPDRVRWPDDSLSKAECGLYQDHLGESVRLANAMGLSSQAIKSIGQHHELTDGSGFPLRINGASMTTAGKILSLVNRYDNLCNPARPGTALTPHEALAHIFAQLKHRFDPVVLSAFIRMMGVYPPGSVVQLIDDRYAIVMSVNSTRPLKPCVLLYESGVARHDALILDLDRAPNISIRRSLKPSSLPSAALDYLAPRPRTSYFFDSIGNPTEEKALA